MRDRIARMNPLQPMLCERKCAEERRTQGQRMKRGAYIVAEAGQGQFGGARAAAGCFRGLQHKHAVPRLRDLYGCCKTVWP